MSEGSAEFEDMAVPASPNGSAHLVKSRDGDEIEVACGRTLHKTLKHAITDSGYYVHPVGYVPVNDKCGNCPWEEVDDV